MKNNHAELKQLALKMYFLNSNQRQHISAGMDALPTELQQYLDEIDEEFNLLKKLSISQRQHIIREMMLPADQNGWDRIREKIDLIKQDNAVYPAKLYAILFE